ncbi:hypothetical protein LTR36_000307 [Oleoguttula mirabilis]|uniref:Uncharacterized protein n=1 Tax=Oleoguttula mirabilis TaxID=1507867 RepID=A0AAV9JY62_9PEZI|nr:hypothetical protein LTR36_000307 [Oleoguttula mirabilis]
MSTNASAITTSLLLFDTDPQPLVASVISADATATAFLLNCREGTDSDDCGIYDASVTVGAWARTSPSAASTGASQVYDYFVSEDTWTFSIHCGMSATVPATCTQINIGGNDGTPTITFTSPATDDGDEGWGYLPVTITAGQEKLAAATASASTTQALTAPLTSSGTAMSASTASGSAASVTGQTSAILTSGSPAGSALPASSTSSGAAAFYVAASCTGNIGLLGLVVAYLLR